MNIIQFELLACIKMCIKPPLNVYRNFFFKSSSCSMEMHSNLSHFRWLIVWTHCSRCTNCGRHSTSVIRSNRCSTKCPESIPFHPNADYWPIVRLLWILMINSEGSNSYFFEVIPMSRYFACEFLTSISSVSEKFSCEIASHLHDFGKYERILNMSLTFWPLPAALLILYLFIPSPFFLPPSKPSANTFPFSYFLLLLFCIFTFALHSLIDSSLFSSLFVLRFVHLQFISSLIIVHFSKNYGLF